MNLSGSQGLLHEHFDTHDVRTRLESGALE